jgi:hypothetical protein
VDAWRFLEEWRPTPSLPGEPKCKKFDDFKKKKKKFLASFKGAKRTVPKGAKPIIVQSKKDDVAHHRAVQECRGLLLGEPKCKKFDDFKKKAKKFLASFKGAKRTWIQITHVANPSGAQSGECG